MVVRNLALGINISKMTIERPRASHFDKVKLEEGITTPVKIVHFDLTLVSSQGDEGDGGDGGDGGAE